MSVISTSYKDQLSAGKRAAACIKEAGDPKLKTRKGQDTFVGCMQRSADKASASSDAQAGGAKQPAPVPHMKSKPLSGGSGSGTEGSDMDGSAEGSTDDSGSQDDSVVSQQP